MANDIDGTNWASIGIWDDTAGKAHRTAGDGRWRVRWTWGVVENPESVNAAVLTAVP